MPPCFDVYVWVLSMDPDSWRWFLDHHVHPTQPREPRRPNFRRKFTDGSGTSADDKAVSEMAFPREDATTIYLRSVDHCSCSITITRE